MAKHKFTSVLCIIITLLTLCVTILFCMGGSLGLEVSASEMAYESGLFSTDKVHELNIVVDESKWNEMIENASAKEYIPCNVIIDGVAVRNVAIRPKGNSSLSSIMNSDSDRYSFKIEFDHYTDGQTFQGLDKLALNNIAQDNTYLKDYIAYQMMSGFDALSPLCSYIYIYVNGEEWGLYLAVEGIEESFLERSFNNQDGNLYKPDSMDMMNGFGNRDEEDGFQMPNMDEIPEGFTMPDGSGGPGDAFSPPDVFAKGEMPEGFADGATMPDMGEMPEDGTRDGIEEDTGEAAGEAFGNDANGTQQNQYAGDRMNRGNFGNNTAGDETAGGNPPSENAAPADEKAAGESQNKMGGFGAMGSNGDVALKYSDDEIDSYSNIFNNAVTDASDNDKTRLINTIKQLNKGENIDEIVNVDEVLRYFVVHNFVLNFDSYTGSMTHNYYLYENDGEISMIAWDYNLSFGGFGGMGGGMGGFGASSAKEASDETASTIDSATQMANYPIDTPTSGTTMEDRPLLNVLLSNEEYLDRYHALFAEFIAQYFTNGKFLTIIENAASLIDSYAEADPSAFCTYEDFKEASAELKAFILLRAESVEKQLRGEIPATSDEQAEDHRAFVDASSIDLLKLGSNDSSFGRGRMPFSRNGNESADTDAENPSGKRSPPEASQASDE